MNASMCTLNVVENSFLNINIISIPIYRINIETILSEAGSESHRSRSIYRGDDLQEWDLQQAVWS